MLYCKLLVTLEGVAQEKKTIDNTAQEQGEVLGWTQNKTYIFFSQSQIMEPILKSNKISTPW